VDEQFITVVFVHSSISFVLLTKAYYRHLKRERDVTKHELGLDGSKQLCSDSTSELGLLKRQTSI